MGAAILEGGAVFVISGAELLTDSNGKVSRRYLIDGWRYLPGAAAGRLWQRIADAPRPVVAAPAIDGGASRILVFSGDDGTNAERVFELKDNHPGFSRELLAYDTGINNQGQWSKAGELPVSLVTTSAVKWRGAIVIPGGEDRPGHRSARTLITVAQRSTATREEKPRFWAALRELLSLPGFRTLTLVFGSFSLANWAIYTWLPFCLYERFNMKLAAAGFSATFYIQAASFGGILLGGWLADRWSRVSARGRALTQCIGVALASPCLFLAGGATSTALLIASLIVFGLGRGFYDCNTMPVLSQIARAELRSTGYGIFNLVGTLTGGIIAAVAGALKNIIGLGGVFQIAALLLLISAVMLSRLCIERKV